MLRRQQARPVSPLEYLYSRLESARSNVARLAQLAEMYADHPRHGDDYARQLKEAEIEAGLLQGQIAEMTDLGLISPSREAA